MNRKQESSSKKQQQGRPFFGGGWHPGVKNHQKNPVTIDTYDASKRIQKKNTKYQAESFMCESKSCTLAFPAYRWDGPWPFNYRTTVIFQVAFLRGYFHCRVGTVVSLWKKNMDWYLVLVLPILKPKLGKNTDLYMSYYSSFTNLFTYAPVDTTIEWNHGL